MRVEKECEKSRSARREGGSRERESREVVRVEKECEERRCASTEGVRVENERVEKECE